MTAETIAQLEDVAAQLRADAADTEEEDRVLAAAFAELFAAAAEQAKAGHDCSLLDSVGQLAQLLNARFEEYSRDAAAWKAVSET
jgi:hypothetical protein